MVAPAITRLVPCTSTSTLSPLLQARCATPMQRASSAASVMTILPAVLTETSANSVIASAATKLLMMLFMIKLQRLYYNSQGLI